MQNRIGVTRSRLACHPHDGGRRGIDFETTTAAARAGNAGKRIHAYVADLPSGSVRATPQFSIKDDSTTHAGAKRHANKSTVSLSRAAPHLTNRGSVGVIFQNHRPLEFTFQCSSQTKPIETGHVRSFDNYSFRNINSPWNNHRDG